MPKNSKPAVVSKSATDATATTQKPNTPQDDAADSAVASTNGQVHPIIPDGAEAANLVETALTEVSPHMKSSLASQANDAEDGVYVAEHPVFSSKFDAKAYQKPEGLRARKIIDKIAEGLHEFGSKLPNGSERVSCDMACTLLQAMNSGIGINLPTRVPLAAIANEIGVNPHELENAVDHNENLFEDLHSYSYEDCTNYSSNEKGVVVDISVANDIIDKVGSREKKWNDERDLKIYRVLDSLDNSRTPLNCSKPIFYSPLPGTSAPGNLDSEHFEY